MRSMKKSRQGIARQIESRFAIATLAVTFSLGLCAGNGVASDFSDSQRLRGGSAQVHYISRSEVVRQAIGDWQRGALRNAVRLSRRALQSNLSPQDHETALFITCVGQTELGQPQRAIPFCTKAVRASRHLDWRHLNNRANARLQAGHVASAIQDYQLAIQLMSDPDIQDPDVLRLRDDVLLANLGLAERRLDAGLEGIAATNPSSRAKPETHFAGDAPDHE